MLVKGATEGNLNGNAQDINQQNMMQNFTFKITTVPLRNNELLILAMHWMHKYIMIEQNGCLKITFLDAISW